MLAGYVLDHFSNAASPGADKPLSYEAEYIINGSGSDEANLEAVAKRLLLMREGANFVYLMTDAAKKARPMLWRRLLRERRQCLRSSV